MTTTPEIADWQRREAVENGLLEASGRGLVQCEDRGAVVDVIVCHLAATPGSLAHEAPRQRRPIAWYVGQAIGWLLLAVAVVGGGLGLVWLLRLLARAAGVAS